MCQDSGKQSRALGLSCIYEDYISNLKLYIGFLCMELHVSPKLLYLNNFYINTKCKVDLSTIAAHFGLSHTLKWSSKWPLFNFIFSDLALMLLKWILLENVNFNGLKWCFERVFYHLTILGVKNAKIKFLKKITGWVHFFFELKNGWFQTRLADLKKHQTSEFLLMNDFYDFF